jgi:hypothetical protein
VRHATRCVAHFTETQREGFLRDTQKYDNSSAYFHTESMLYALWKYLGIRYNPERIPVDSPFYLEDAYIHGAIFGNGGTCASLPILYAAIGRRLGYPIKLVHAFATAMRVGHRFARWDDPNGERMNFEANPTGMSRHPDDYYRTGTYALPADHERRCCFLQSMTPRQELADFLFGRAGWWLDAGNDREAAHAALWAWALHPENELFRARACTILMAWHDKLVARRPPRFPRILAQTWTRRFRDTVPLTVERDLICLELEERILDNKRYEDQWWAPLRRGRDVRVPAVVTGIYWPEKGVEMRFQFPPVRPLC